MNVKSFNHILLIFIAVVLASCGGHVTAPPTAKITINPSSVKITDGTIGATLHTQYFTISVNDDKGRPIRGAKISISYVWAVPDSLAVVQLYDGTTPKNSPFDAYTDENGVYNLRFDFTLGVGAYKADLEARSGEVFGSSSFEVSTGS